MEWGTWSVGNRNVIVDEVFDRVATGSIYNAYPSRAIALLFMTQSVRTRVGFERAAHNRRLKVINVYERRDGESMRDFGFTLATIVDAIATRLQTQQDFNELVAGVESCARNIPVINGGTNGSHPVQALIDVYTLQATNGIEKGATIGLFGAQNNRAMRSFCQLAERNYNLAPFDYDERKRYSAVYCVTYGTHDSLPADLTCKVMHPFPRGNVVPTSYDFTGHDLYHKQMANAVKIREAVLCAVL